ncbi:MAG: hypothetical protein QOH45_1590 [Pseudonocardiales bacterium]|nr:hypothetical protein [Pseudonocardiales bacterium]
MSTDQSGPNTDQVFDELTRQRSKEIINRYPVTRSAQLPL